MRILSDVNTEVSDLQMPKMWSNGTDRKRGRVMSLLIAIVTDFFMATFLKVNDTTMLMMAIIFAGGLAGFKD